MMSRDIICQGCLQDGLFLKKTVQGIGQRFALIADSQVALSVAQSLTDRLTALGLYAELFTFAAGEASKTRKTKEELEDALFAKGFGRDSAIIAVGGGVTTDLAGFVAATFCRGVSYINIPTTLLGMVDAAIGGKTGVNTAYGKNVIGAIYQPAAVVIDIDTLKTLPQKEYVQGIAECIKYGAIQDKALFSFLEENVLRILEREPALLQTIIRESIRIKQDIVAEDERESGKRRLLNFGHTIGHALETLSEYSMSHGNAVAIGMVEESRLFVEQSLMEVIEFKRLINLISAYGFPTALPKMPIEPLLKAMTFDKKSQNTLPRFVALRSIGEPYEFAGNYCTHVGEETIAKVLKR